MTHMPHMPHRTSKANLAILFAVGLLLTACTTKPAAKSAPVEQATAPRPSQVADLAAQAPHLKAATKAFNAQDYPAAAREYEAAINAGADTPLVHFRYGYALHVTGQPRRALPHHIAATHIENPHLRIDALYNAACANALLNNRDEALGFLSRAIHAGFKDTAQLAKDTDLDSLREDRDFKDLVAAIPSSDAAPHTP